jgi:hypothetical protein
MMRRPTDNPVAFAVSVLGVEPHPKQAAFLVDRHAWLVLCAARRSGKSLSLALLIIWVAVVHAIEGKPAVILLSAPVLDQAKVTLSYVLRLLRASPVGGLITKCIDSPYPEVQLGPDVRIMTRSVADHGKHVRGFGRDVALVVLDEAGYASEDVVLEVLGPLLADRGDAVMVLSSTPTRIGSVLHRYYERGRDGTDPRIASHHMTALDNPHLNAAYIQAQRAELTERQWRTEWLGEWVDGEGSLFKWSDVLHCAQLEPGASHGSRYTIGYDPAKIRDGSGLVILEHSTMPRRVVRALDLGGRDYSAQIRQVAALSREHGSARVIVDAGGGGNVVLDLLRAAGVPCEGITWNASRKAQHLTALAAAIERHEMLFPADSALMNELRWFELKRGPAGSVKYEAAPGQKDDLVCALALALVGAGGVAPTDSYAHLDWNPFLRTSDQVAFTPEGRPVVTRALEDGFEPGSWTTMPGTWTPWLR